METTKTSGIQFKRTAIANYDAINAPGRYELKVLSNVSEGQLVTDADGKNPRYIVNFAAIAADKLPQLAEVFKGKEEVEIEATNGLFMTGNIWKRDGKNADLPMKGEIVDVTVDLVEGREEGAGLLLRVTNIKRKPAAASTKVDLSIFEAAPVAEAKAEEKTLVTSK